MGPFLFFSLHEVGHPMTGVGIRWPSYRLGVLLTLSLGISGLPGCAGDKRKPVFPVTGQVLVDGKPAENAIVFFHNQEIPPSRADPRPCAVVGRDGCFRLTTYESDDGAPAGKYRVTVIWTTKSVVGDGDEKNLLPARYMSPNTSGLTATIDEGPTQLAPFRLTRK
jgi:hypothetical protein